MFERIVVALVLIALGYIVYCAITRCQLRKASAAASADPLLAELKRGVPTIVYFTTPTCAPCRFQQMPALEQVQADLGERIQIVRVDATENAEAADRWGVFTVPMTFVLDGQFTPREVNHGVADATKLKRQLEAVSFQ